jgi:hypothetical protein
MATLTDGRNAVWNAINNAATLLDNGTSVFKKQIKFNNEEPLINQATIEESLCFADLPCMAIWNQSMSMEWFRNTDQEWLNTLLVTFWTPTHALPDAEDWAEKIIVAIFETLPSGNSSPATYVRLASASIPRIGSVTFDPVDIGGENTIKSVRTTIAVTLRFLKSIC